MPNSKSRKFYSEYPAIVLFVALALALVIWWLWLKWGMVLAHSQVSERSLLKAGANTLVQRTDAAEREASIVELAQRVDVATANLTRLRSQLEGTPQAPLRARLEPDVQDEAEKKRELYFAEAGQTGDAFGGLNALMTAIAGALVAWAGFMQYLSLSEARAEADAERDARRRQEFEALFFRMLDLSRDLISKIEFRINRIQAESGITSTEPRTGAAALDKHAARIFEESKDEAASEAALLELVTMFRRRVYDTNAASFGPYFRLLFQIFKLISESPLDHGEKIRYANIARGQLSEAAVLLLALNGLTEVGHPFIRYIEEFGLLEHMLKKYRERFDKHLLLGYRRRAFLGSKEREELSHELQALGSATLFSRDDES